MQFPHEPAAGAARAAGGGGARAALRSHLQLDRAEVDQRVREGAGAAQHGGHPHRPHDTHAHQLRVNAAKLLRYIFTIYDNILTF